MKTGLIKRTESQGIFHNDCFSFPAWNSGVFSSGLHCENLEGILEVNSLEWGPYNTESPGVSNSNHTDPPVLCGSQVEASGFSLGLCSWTSIWFSVSSYLSSLGGISFTCDINFLMDIKWVVGFSVCSALLFVVRLGVMPSFKHLPCLLGTQKFSTFSIHI